MYAKSNIYKNTPWHAYFCLGEFLKPTMKHLYNKNSTTIYTEKANLCILVRSIP